jgi:hypothetical protein
MYLNLAAFGVGIIVLLLLQPTERAKSLCFLLHSGQMMAASTSIAAQPFVIPPMSQEEEG